MKTYQVVPEAFVISTFDNDIPTILPTYVMISLFIFSAIKAILLII